MIFIQDLDQVSTSEDLPFLHHISFSSRFESLSSSSWQSMAVTITLRLALPFQQPMAIVDSSTLITSEEVLLPEKRAVLSKDSHALT